MDTSSCVLQSAPRPAAPPLPMPILCFLLPKYQRKKELSEHPWGPEFDSLYNTWVLETTKHSPGWRLVPSTPSFCGQPTALMCFPPSERVSPPRGWSPCHLFASSEGWAQKKQLEASSKPLWTQRALSGDPAPGSDTNRDLPPGPARWWCFPYLLISGELGLAKEG